MRFSLSTFVAAACLLLMPVKGARSQHVVSQHPTRVPAGLLMRLSDLEPQKIAASHTMQAPQSPGMDRPNPAAAGNNQEGADASPRPRRRSARPRFDPQVVQRGQAAFDESCTQCHDADRALEKRKSGSAWLATVRRMARMDDAEIDSADIVPIATYLASLSAPQLPSSTEDGADDTGTDEGAAEEDYADLTSQLDEAVEESLEFGSGLNISATISTLWRGGNDNLENPDFFVDAWVRGDWQPDGPLRGRVTACTSCHSDQTSDGGFTLELVEAAAYLDLLHHHKEKDRRPEQCKPDVDAELMAGRFVVPFGAYYAMSHPGIYRTVTNPLIYNMGRQVNDNPNRAPVLPMPYSDEGVGLSGAIPLLGELRANVDVYAVNGLQRRGTGIGFTPSRSYADNNSRPAVGGRATVGNRRIRLGGSIMSGRYEDDTQPPLNYKLVGGDATARFCDDKVRLYFEYAMRRNDTIFPRQQIAHGIVSELEVLLLSDPNLNALVRYDTLKHRDFNGESSIHRFTWGLSTTLIGSSLFIINHEHWNFPSATSEDVDVFGFRWVATF